MVFRLLIFLLMFFIDSEGVVMVGVFMLFYIFFMKLMVLVIEFVFGICLWFNIDCFFCCGVVFSVVGVVFGMCLVVWFVWLG